MAISTSDRRPLIMNFCNSNCRRLNCSENWIPKVTITLLLVLAIFLLIILFQPFQTEINLLAINANNVRTVDEKFLSVALDSSLIADDFLGFNMSDAKLVAMMIPLGGGYLRIGGTMADRLQFVESDVGAKFKSHLDQIWDGGECAYEETFCRPIHRPNFTMSAEEWKNLNRLAIMTGFTILFDLNSLMRKADGSWDSKNAEELIAFSEKHGFRVIWQLGNEPNAYRHTFDYSVNATQLARDFQKLRKILKRYKLYQNSMTVGPDITKPKPHAKHILEYLQDFLDNSSRGTINAVTWHQYYFRGKDSTLTNFLDPDLFDNLAIEIALIRMIVYRSKNPALPIWLGETSSAYGGGSPAFSNRFISTFIWMDKLGLSAKYGIDLVIRQSLFKGYYALLDENYDPNPDWWLSIMYKKLVGNKVVDCSLLANPDVRMYCHCLKKDNEYSRENGLVVFGMNMKYSESVIRIQEINADSIKYYNIMAFIFQTHFSILSRHVFCNNKLLQMINNRLPYIEPIMYTSAQITLPSFSFGFWIISGSEFEMCS